MFDFDAFLDTDLTGKRVQLAPWMDQWARGDRFGTVIETQPSGGITLICKVRLDKSNKVVQVADTNLTLV